MQVTFARESLTDSLWDEAMPLLHAHWTEIAHYPDIALDPDRAVYQASEQAGILRVYTARLALHVTRSLIGYCCYFVRPAPHYRGSIQAAQDVLYLDPAVRGGTGYRFVAWCDDQLRGEGVQLVMQHAKLAHPALGRILAHQGYEQIDTIWGKRLDGDHERDHRGRDNGDAAHRRQPAASEGEGGGGPGSSHDATGAP